MRTNLGKWKYYMSLINDREKEYIKENIGEIPEKIYMVYPIGEIRTLNVTKVIYWNKLYYNKYPTRADVAKIKEYAEEMRLTLDNILIHWERREEDCIYSGAEKYTDLNKRFFIDFKMAEKKLAEIKENERLVKSGSHIYCGYCGKTTPIEKAHKIDGIWFCKNGCYGCFIMAKEG
jgi:hypothetical protein